MTGPRGDDPGLKTAGRADVCHVVGDLSAAGAHRDRQPARDRFVLLTFGHQPEDGGAGLVEFGFLGIAVEGVLERLCLRPELLERCDDPCDDVRFTNHGQTVFARIIGGNRKQGDVAIDHEAAARDEVAKRTLAPLSASSVR